jgi:hypothetical protein
MKIEYEAHPNLHNLRQGRPPLPQELSVAAAEARTMSLAP